MFRAFQYAILAYPCLGVLVAFLVDSVVEGVRRHDLTLEVPIRVLLATYLAFVRIAPDVAAIEDLP